MGSYLYLAMMDRFKLWTMLAGLAGFLACGLLLTQPVPVPGLTEIERIVLAEQLRRHSFPCAATTEVKVLGLFAASQRFLVSCGPTRYVSWQDRTGAIRFARFQESTRRQMGSLRTDIAELK